MIGSKLIWYPDMSVTGAAGVEMEWYLLSGKQEGKHLFARERGIIRIEAKGS